MIEIRTQHRSDSTKLAITRVLQAEREVKSAIEACAQEAERLLEEARAQARASGRRTQRRTTAIHARCAERTRDRIQILRSDALSDSVCDLPDDGDQAALDEALERLADRLIGKNSQR